MRGLHPSCLPAAVALVLLTGCAPEPAPDAVATSPSPTLAASPTPSTAPDPYAGYFDERAAQEAPARTSFQGSFGDAGAVAVVRDEDRTLPAGRYDVEVMCIGPETGVDVTLTSIADEVEIRTVNVGCTATGIVGRTDTIEIAGQGLRIELDSGGGTGAYLVTVRDAAS